MSRWMTSLAGLLLACGIAFGGCIATETGNPSLGPEIDRQRVEGDIPPDDPQAPHVSVVTITGGPGAVEPPEGVLLGWGVEAPGPPSSANVAPDGSFNLYVPALPGELVRIVARGADGAPGMPFDLRVTTERGLEPVEPVHACLRVEPPEALARIEVGGEARVTLVNDCDHAITRQPARLRDPDGPLILVDEGPLTVSPRASTTVLVQAPVPVDDLVLLPIEAPSPELRVFTVFAD